MHHYYRHVLALTEVNDIIIQFFRERSDRPRRDKIETVNEDFVLRNKHIECKSPTVFRDNPASLLEMFVLIAHRQDVIGVSASTIRLMRESLNLIDENFRQNPKHTQLFMRLLKAPYKVVTQLTRMRRYGVLARYIPEFGQIVGQMQHDLFHIYTVDAHTMMVIGNMRRFRYPEAKAQTPVHITALTTCQNRSCCISPGFITTSAKAEVATIRSSAPWTPGRSACATNSIRRTLTCLLAGREASIHVYGIPTPRHLRSRGCA